MTPTDAQAVLPHYIAGAFQNETSGETFTDVNPSDSRDVIARVPAGDPEDMARAAAAYDAAGVTAELAPFFDDIPRRFSEAQLVISRAGASSVADLAVIGRPAILIPLAAALRDEQTANARSLVDAGAAVLIPESRLDPATLAEHIGAILSDPAAAMAMARAALSRGRPQAAQALADLAEAIAGGLDPEAREPQQENAQ